MPLQNRVDPFGAIQAVPDRGTLMGIRGGRFHAAHGVLGNRLWAGKRWIACRLSFKGRRRVPMTEGYTHLFFLDEATALAAGHRPCFECRREDALRFQKAFATALRCEALPKVDVMDVRLDAERRDGRMKRLHGVAVDEVPTGAMIALGQEAFLVTDTAMLRWSFAGYGPPEQKLKGRVSMLTPPAIAAAIGAGYRPHIHASAALPLPESDR